MAKRDKSPMHDIIRKTIKSGEHISKLEGGITCFGLATGYHPALREHPCVVYKSDQILLDNGRSQFDQLPQIIGIEVS